MLAETDNARRSKPSCARRRRSTQPRRARLWRTKLACGASSGMEGRAGRGGARGPSRRSRKRRADVGAGAEIDGDSAHAMPLRKRRKGASGGRGYVPVPVGALEGPNGLRVKGLAVIEDEDSG